MPFEQILLFVLVGCVGGLMAGMLGLGGGGLYVPVFIWGFESLFGFPGEIIHQLAVGTALAITVPSVIMGARTHYKNGNLIARALTPLLLGGISGALLASLLLTRVNPEMFKYLLGFFLCFVGLRQILGSKKEQHTLQDIKFSKPMLSGIGFLSGAGSAFFGIGGGVITVPLLNLAARFPMLKAVGTSSGLIVFSASAGLLSLLYQTVDQSIFPDGSWGAVYIWGLLCTLPTAFIASYVGAVFANRINAKRLKQVFGLLTLFLGGRLLVLAFLY